MQLGCVRTGALVLVLVLVGGGLARAETFRVGPGQVHTAIADVPWEDLDAGDVVEIHARAAPYREKIIIAASGTAARPVVIRGIPDAAGKLPVIDGGSATTRQAFESWNEERGVIKIGGTDVPAGPPAHIVIEQLDVRGALPGTRFTDSLGRQVAYTHNAAAIYVEEGSTITIRSCTLRDSGNGLYVNELAREVLVEKNQFEANGVAGSYTNHHAYTEADGIVFQLNELGRCRAGALGNAIEDHSVEPVIRYNRIEGGNHQIALFESEAFAGTPGFGVAYVYGNVLIEPDGGDGQAIVAWGGAGPDTGLHRKGTLFFHHNTILSARADRTTIFEMPTDDETVYARNNVFATTEAGSTLALGIARGVLELDTNWITDGHVASHGIFAGTLTETGTIGGLAPGFVDQALGDLHLAPGSPCLDKAMFLPADMPAEHQPTEQLAGPRASEPRPTVGAPDLGAYESLVGADPGEPGEPDDDDVGQPPDDDDDPTPTPEPDDASGAPGGGCGCTVGGSPPPSRGLAWLTLFGLLGALVLRRARS